MKKIRWHQRGQELDLHGLRHEDARKVMVAKVEALWGTDEPLTVITGHSPRMKEIVSEVLGEYGVRCSEDEMNPGVLRTEIP